jgi:hypothetical protein
LEGVAVGRPSLPDQLKFVGERVILVADAGAVLDDGHGNLPGER